MVSLRYPPDSGGAENQAHLLAQALQRRGVALSVLTTATGPAPTRDCTDGVAVTRLPYRPGGAGTARLLLRTLAWIVARRRRFDILHAHIGNPFSATAILAAHLVRRPSLVKIAASGGWSDLLSMSSGAYGLSGRVLLPVLLRASCFVVLNGESEAELAARVGAPRVRRIPNGLLPAADRWRGDVEHGCVFAAGRLDRQKGFDLLIDACAEVPREVVIAGDGPDRDALAQQAAAVGTRLTLLGQVDRSKMQARLREAALVVAPSRAEGMSNVLLEALATGCPVVASRIPGNVDLVEHGKSGLLVEAEDVAGLRHAINSMLAQPAATRSLAAAGAERAAREFSIDAVAAQYADLYSALCDH